ncbi:MAG: hypothetical protein KF745_10315 [Phycisphaeraceae bacterium]|nr:hypothetical protein [Phycisphaeraceae bacterium]
MVYQGRCRLIAVVFIGICISLTLGISGDPSSSVNSAPLSVVSKEELKAASDRAVEDALLRAELRAIAIADGKRDEALSIFRNSLIAVSVAGVLVAALVLLFGNAILKDRVVAMANERMGEYLNASAGGELIRRLEQYVERGRVAAELMEADTTAIGKRLRILNNEAMPDQFFQIAWEVEPLTIDAEAPDTPVRGAYGHGRPFEIPIAPKLSIGCKRSGTMFFHVTGLIKANDDNSIGKAQVCITTAQRGMVILGNIWGPSKDDYPIDFSGVLRWEAFAEEASEDIGIGVYGVYGALNDTIDVTVSRVRVRVVFLPDPIPRPKRRSPAKIR